MEHVLAWATSFMAVTIVAAAASLAVATAGPKHAAKKGAGIQACGLMPDTKTSVRWEQFDKPYLEKAFKAAGIKARVVNAQGDAQKQKTQADQCLSDGAKVLIIAPNDSASAAAIEKDAKAKGAVSIDYDRQVEGGVAVLYASFDGHTVGVLQGTAVAGALKSKHGAVVAQLNGGQEDANSFLFKGGYDSILNPLFKAGALKKGPDQFVPGWDNQKAGTIYEQMLVKTGNKIDGVVAANDGIANAVVVAEKAHKLKAVPLSGQDATTQGVQNIISGYQTMTVFKDVRKLATATAGAAIAIIHGKKPPTTGFVTTKGRSKEPAYLIAPQTITKANYTMLFTLGFLKKADVCNGEYKKYCDAFIPPPASPSQSFPSEPRTASGENPLDSVPAPVEAAPGATYPALGGLSWQPAQNPVVANAPVTRSATLKNKQGQRFRIFVSAGKKRTATRFIAKLAGAVEAFPQTKPIPTAVGSVEFSRVLLTRVTLYSRRSQAQLASIRNQLPTKNTRSLRRVLQRIHVDAETVIELAARDGYRLLQAKVRRRQLRAAEVAALNLPALMRKLVDKPGAPFLFSPAEIPPRPAKIGRWLRMHPNNAAVVVQPIGPLPGKNNVVWFAFDPPIEEGQTTLYIQTTTQSWVRIRAKRGTVRVTFRRTASSALDYQYRDAAGGHYSDWMLDKSTRGPISYTAAVIGLSRGGMYAIGGFHQQTWRPKHG